MSTKQQRKTAARKARQQARRRHEVPVCQAIACIGGPNQQAAARMSNERLAQIVRLREWRFTPMTIEALEIAIALSAMELQKKR